MNKTIKDIYRIELGSNDKMNIINFYYILKNNKNIYSEIGLTDNSIYTFIKKYKTF